MLPIEHLILNGLVWKLNRLSSLRDLGMRNPIVTTMYYKCIYPVNKKCILMFIFHIVLVAHVCLTWYQSRGSPALLQREPPVSVAFINQCSPLDYTFLSISSNRGCYVYQCCHSSVVSSPGPLRLKFSILKSYHPYFSCILCTH